MSVTTTSIPAVHDWHLREVLADLGLLVQVENGFAVCHRCKGSISFENLGGILVVGEGEYALLCDAPLCLSPESGK